MAVYTPKPFNWNLGLLGQLAGHTVAPTDLTGTPKPWHPELTPGMYDPQLDWQQASEQQGYDFTKGDYATQQARTSEGLYGTHSTFTDPVTGQTSNVDTPGLLAQFQQRLDRGQADYNTSTQNLQRNFMNLGTSQAQAARSQGVQEGGSLAQALRKRSENQGREQGALDTNWRRFQEDTARDKSNALYGVMTGVQDATQGFGRASAAHDLYGSQLGEAKIQSAQQMGTLPTAPPPGTFVDPDSPIGKALGVKGGTFAGVPYQRDRFGNLRPVAGFSPSAQSVMASGSLLGTGFATGRPLKRR